MLCIYVVCKTVRNSGRGKRHAAELTRQLSKKRGNRCWLGEKNPSIDAVRIELGSLGSKTTIHRYLKEIEDFDPRPRAFRELLSDELTELVAGLLERMTEEGGEALAYAQARFDEQRSELEQKLYGLNAELTSLRREVDSQKGALALQEDELQICQASLQAELTRNARLSQNCSDLELRVQWTHSVRIE